MEAGKFRVVIIGAGAISFAAHVPAVLASPFASLVGLVDPDLQRARTLCGQYGIEPAVGADFEQLGVSFDGAIIATPNDLHAPVAMSLVKKGIPVLVEKPVATSVAMAEQLTEMARTNGVVVAVGYHTRHSGACRALKYAVESGHFGLPVRFAHQDGGRGGWSPMSGYNLDLKRAGGGVLVTTGTHFLDRLVWLWGSPNDVTFRDNAMGGPESHCIAHFEFGNEGQDISGSAVFSKVVSLPERTVVQTTEGLLVMGSDAAETITFRPRRDPRLEYEVRLVRYERDERSLYQRQLEDFVSACRRGTKPCVDAAAGTKSLELMTRLYASRKPLKMSTATEIPEQVNA